MSEARFNPEGLLDIDVPPPPAASGTDMLLWIVVVALILLVAWFAWRRRQRAPRVQARRRLDALRTAHDAQTLTARAAAFRLAVVLRQGLGLGRLSVQTPVPASIATLDERWRAFLTALDAARYAPRPCSDTDLQRLFAEAGFWLRHWP